MLSVSLDDTAQSDEPLILPQSRQLEVFSRTLNATASHLIGGDASSHYHNALGDIHRELRRPMMQRSVFALAKANPRELVRSNFSSTEIQQRALAHVPDELLRNIPTTASPYSLFQGYEATRPPEEDKKKKGHGRHSSRNQKALTDGKDGRKGHTGFSNLRDKKDGLDHRLEMMGVRKSMCASEIVELDRKLANLHTMRKLVVERLAALEQEETDIEHEIGEVDIKLEDLQEELDIAAAQAPQSPPTKPAEPGEGEPLDVQADDTAFMSESIYQKLPSPKTKKRKNPRRVSMPILHEHMQPGSKIKEFQAHNDMITALDFDVPFGTMVSAALDDTLRVWDLSAGRCLGMLEGHLSSVRCVQVEENLVASGSNDATVRIWDLSQADYSPPLSSSINKRNAEGQDHDREDADDDDTEDAGGLFTSSNVAIPPAPSSAAMADCPLYTLSSHVAEVTALHFQSNNLVSGSADKTLRQWDLETGRCMQTLDVLWAAAQASATTPSFGSNTTPATESAWYRPTTGRAPTAEADFVGALQLFQSAVACGTADSVVRLWDLRSGMVQRSLIGHTGPITALQFDDVHLVTGSADRSIRVSLASCPFHITHPDYLQIWDLRTGSIYDAFAYESPITSMMFDTRRISAAAGESVVKVYDKADGHQWDCGAGAQEIDVASDSPLATVEKVRLKDGYMVEGRKDGVVGIWAC